MAVSLVKEYGIPHRGFLSQAMLDEYNAYALRDYVYTIFDDHAPMIMRHLAHNCLNGFAVLIMYRDHYDNVTGELALPE